MISLSGVLLIFNGIVPIGFQEGLSYEQSGID